MTESLVQHKSQALSKSQLEQLALDEADVGAANILGMIVWLDRRYPGALIEQALNHIIEHEQALRLRLSRNADGYTQYEQPHCRAEIAATDAAMTVEGFIEKCETDMASFSFALEAPLYDFSLFRLAASQGGRVGLRAFFHHAIIDGAGAGIFSHMLTRYCALLYEGRALPRVAHRFAETEDREKFHPAAPAAEADEEFWRDFLEKNPPRLSKINPAAGVPSGPGPGRRLKKALPPEEGRRLNAGCEAEGISPAVLFQAALVIYLHGLNPDSGRINFGSMISNRLGLKRKNMLGNFALELLHSVPIAAGDSVRNLYAAVKTAAVASYRHARCSYEDILELALGMYPGLESLRDVLFSYLPPMAEEGRAFDLYWLANYCPETSLEFTVFNLIDKDEFTLIFDYREDVFSPQEAERAMEEMLLITMACLQNPLGRIQDMAGSRPAGGD